MLSVTGNRRILDNKIVRGALETLQHRLPPAWYLRRRNASEAEPQLELSGPEGAAVRLLVELERQLEPRDVARIARRLEARQARSPGALGLVVSSFLSPRTRQLLSESQLGYLDLTGNCRLVCDRPGLFLCTSGKDANPAPSQRPTRSLKGPIAGRLVRALCDFFPPIGVRALAERVGADPGYVSRLVHWLSREALLEREPRGAVQAVHWEQLVRRWAQNYRPFVKEAVSSYLEPRGLSAFTAKLRGASFRYVLTASCAAAAVAPVAPAWLAVAYVDDPAETAQNLGLVPAESGANVWLVSPFDPVVFERSWSQDDLHYTAWSQVAADLLNSPGRGPEEAEALFRHMAKDEHAWRI